MGITQLHEEFLSYLDLERGYSPLTITSYRSDFRLFLRHLTEGGEQVDLEKIDRQAMRQYIAELRTQELKPSSIARYLNSLRSFWHCLRANEYTECDPFLGILVPKRSRPMPVYLSAQECTALLEASERQRRYLRVSNTEGNYENHASLHRRRNLCAPPVRNSKTAKSRCIICCCNVRLFLAQCSHSWQSFLINGSFLGPPILPPGQKTLCMCSLCDPRPILCPLASWEEQPPPRCQQPPSQGHYGPAKLPGSPILLHTPDLRRVRIEAVLAAGEDIEEDIVIAVVCSFAGCPCSILHPPVESDISLLVGAVVGPQSRCRVDCCEPAGPSAYTLTGQKQCRPAEPWPHERRL